MNNISSHPFPRRQFKELRGSAERTVRELDDDRSCSVKKVAQHTRPSQPKRPERYGFRFWVGEKKWQVGATSGVANGKIKIQGVRKNILLRGKTWWSEKWRKALTEYALYPEQILQNLPHGYTFSTGRDDNRTSQVAYLLI